MDGGSWQATVHGVTKSQKQLSNKHFHFRGSGEYEIQEAYVCFSLRILSRFEENISKISSLQTLPSNYQTVRCFLCFFLASCLVKGTVWKDSGDFYSLALQVKKLQSRHCAKVIYSAIIYWILLSDVQRLIIQSHWTQRTYSLRAKEQELKQYVLMK